MVAVGEILWGWKILISCRGSNFRLGSNRDAEMSLTLQRPLLLTFPLCIKTGLKGWAPRLYNTGPRAVCVSRHLTRSATRFCSGKEVDPTPVKTSNMFPKKQPEGGKLTVYVDCGESPCQNLLANCFSVLISICDLVSPYSWFGFTNTMRYRPHLNEYGVTVDVIPFFLGAAREGAGNPFTPTPQWKEAFSAQDSNLTGEMLGLKVVRPKEFPILSLFVSFPRDSVPDDYLLNVTDRPFE